MLDLDRIKDELHKLRGRGGLCGYGMQVDDKSIIARATQPCFQNVPTDWKTIAKSKAFYSYSWPDKPLSEEFVYMMIDPAVSPWAPLIPFLEIPSKEWVHQNGYVFKDLDKIPKGLLYNFLIATRMPMEYPSIVQDWLKFREFLPSRKALYFALLSSPVPIEGRHRLYGNRFMGHTVLQETHAYKAAYRFIAARPNLSQTFWPGNDAGCWNIWEPYQGRADRDIRHPYNHFTFEERLDDINRWYKEQEEVANNGS